MRYLCLPAALLLSITPLAVGFAAEAPGSAPPRMIRILREEVKPGKFAAHRELALRYAQTLTKSRSPGYYQALVSVTGARESWFVRPYDSYAAIAKDIGAATGSAADPKLTRIDDLNGDLLAASRTIIAINRPDLGYWPGAGLADMSSPFFSIQIVATVAGHVTDFVEARRLVKAAHEKAAVKENFALYQVESGLPTGTFLIVIPYASLGDLDKVAEIHGRPYDDALGDEGHKRLQSLTISGTASSETMLFSVDPQMSRLSIQ